MSEVLRRRQLAILPLSNSDDGRIRLQPARAGELAAASRLKATTLTFRTQAALEAMINKKQVRYHPQTNSTVRSKLTDERSDEPLLWPRREMLHHLLKRLYLESTQLKGG